MNKDECKNTLANNIRQYRKELGLTAQQLGDRLQKEIQLKTAYARNTITEWENGKYEPPLYVIIAFADIFNISVDELVRRKRTKGD